MAERKVEVYIPRVEKGDPNMFVGINGVNYLIPRGKKTMVPKAVADEINRSIKAQDKFYETVDTLSKQDEQAT